LAKMQALIHMFLFIFIIPYINKTYELYITSA
jgi:hypothetical protein